MTAFSGFHCSLIWYHRRCTIAFVLLTTLDARSILIDRSYVVGMHIRLCRDERPNSPAAAWYVFSLFGKTWLSEPRFSKKRMAYSALPQANRACNG